MHRVCFLFTWVINPIVASYVSSADFTPAKRFKSSLKENIYFNSACALACGICFIILVFFGSMTWEAIPGVITAAGNVFGLLVCVLLMAFGMVDIPRCLWRYSDVEKRLHQLTRKVRRGIQGCSDGDAKLANLFARLCLTDGRDDAW